VVVSKKGVDGTFATVRAPMKSDLVSAVEAAYALEQDHQRWLDGLVDRVRPVLDRGLGIFGLVVDLTGGTPADAKVLAVASSASERVLEAGMMVMREVTGDDSLGRRFQFAHLVGRLSHTLGPAFGGGNSLRRKLSAFGIADSVYLRAGEVQGALCVLSGPVPTRETQPRHRVRSLEHLTAHVASGLRLRMRASLGAEEPEAILDPGGRVHDASEAAKSPGARMALRRAALAAERARGPLRRRNADEAVALWRPLVEGRWTLVDRFESDGRRFLIARRNTFEVSARWPLTDRERQVAVLAAQGHSNKLIAYELGIGRSTVSTHLLRATAKLGVRSRVELVQALAGPSAVAHDAGNQ
jgi:DNA-binding CsgD family transcriptional regulator